MTHSKQNTSKELLDQATALFKSKKYDEAFGIISAANSAYPKDAGIQYVFQYMLRCLGYDQSDLEILGPNTEKKLPYAYDTKAELLAVVEMVREKMRTQVDDFFTAMKNKELQRDDFLSKNSLIDNSKSFLLVLRKWNSYTPIIPAGPVEHSVGGGYFISYKGNGIIIDPGYDFIENFYRAGGRIIDIDCIILTHAHGDHTNDFESILSLVYQFNQKNKLNPGDIGYKRIDIYANIGSFMKLTGILDLRGMEYINSVHTLSPGLKYHLFEGVQLEPLQAYHDELITKKYAVGLKFIIDDGVDKKKLVFTSDTGLFPGGKMSVDGNTTTSQTEIWQTYPDSDDIDLLFVHIGSIKKHEFETDINTDPDKVFYPNHLGILGTMRVITSLRPKLAVVSEFGEELSEFQEDLITYIAETVNECCSRKTGLSPKVLPGDLPFIYDIATRSVYCTLSKTMVPFEKIKFGLPEARGNKRFYYYDEDKIKDLAKLHEQASFFEAERNGHEGLYFKSNA